jgi:endonuclease/exonuclease/phosphatase (EEP) superfamily protein YafD
MSTNDLRSKVTTAAYLAVLVLSAPLIAGFFGKLHPALDSFAHFRVHLAILMAIATLPLLASKYRKEGAAALLLAVSAFATTSNLLGLGPVHAGSFQPRSDEQPVYKLLQLNLRYNNPEPNKVLSLIGRLRPDVVTLEEVSDMWKEKLALLSSAYPYSIICPYPNRVFGVAILSSRPMADGRQANCYERGSLAIAPVDFGGRVVEVAALHLGWPWPFEQSRQIAAVAQPLSQLGETALLAGDLNATPWSAATRRVGELGGLTMVPSVGPSWQWWRLPEFLRFSGLPIDQAFHKGDVILNSAHTLAEAGSDHLPVLVEFSLKPKAKEQEAVTATASAATAGSPRG